MNINVHIATTKSGKWLAATTSSPYFCFEADSESEVLSIARAAARFYSANAELIKESSSKRECANTAPELTDAHEELLCA